MLLLAVGATALFTSNIAKSAVLTWDGSNTGNSQADGGTGTWDSNTTANWWNGSTNVVWPNSGTDNDALFANTAGTVTISSVTANDITFGTTGYVLSGASTLTLNGTTPTINTGANSATIGNNTATVLAGTAGLNKTGTGNLTLNSSAVSTFTGGLNVKGGTLTLSYGNLATPTNLINNGNALTLSNGSTLAITAKSTGTTAQTFNGITINGGVNLVTNNANGGTGSTLTLGAITQGEAGGVVAFSSTGTTTINISGVTSGSYVGSYVFVGDPRTTAGRWAIESTAPAITTVSGTGATATTMANVTGTSTVYTATGTFTLTGNQTAFGIQSNNTSSTSTYNLAGFTLTTNGLLGLQPTNTTTVQGAGSLQVGAGNEMVIAGAGPITISSTITNKAASNSNVTYVGGNTLLLSGNNSFSGQLSVDSGTVQIGTGGAVNSASGIKVFGGKFLDTNTTTAITPTVTLSGGAAGATIDGTGTINTVNVSSLAANKIVNGNGGTTALTIGNLTFNGDGAIDVRTAGAAGLTVTGTLTTTPANGKVTINVPAAPTWVTGNTYNLVGFGSWAGTTSDLIKGTITGLGARQTAALGKSASTNGFITLAISGDSVVWTGAASNAWTTNTVGTPFNWKTQTGLADTEFLASDDVIFNDTGANTSVNISTANVTPNTITFSNSTNNYTISSSGGFGITSGNVTKSGSATATLTTTNTYTGPTTINGGTLQVSGGNAIANSGLVTLGNVAGATFQVVGSESIGALSGGGATGGAVSIDSGQTLSLTSGTQTYAGTVSGSGALTSAGATQTINGTVSHSGGLSVTSGALTLGGSSNSFTGTVNVSTGAGIVATANGALGATGAGNEVVLAGTGTAVSGAIGLSGGVNYTSTKKVIGAGVGNTAANGVFASVQRGIVQSISGNNTFAGNIELNSTGISRFGSQNGAQLTLTGTITSTALNTQVLFRSGDTTGDFVTLASTGNSWALDTIIFTAAPGAAGLRLGANNALPTNVGVVAGGNTTGAGTSLDLNGFNQTLNGLNASNGTLHITNLSASASVLTLNPDADKNTASITNQTVIEDGTGVVSLVKTSTFQQILAGTNNYTGTTSIQAGSLLFAKPGALYNANTSNWTASKIKVDSGATVAVSIGSAGEFTTSDVSTLLAGLSTVNNNGLKAGSNFMMNATAAVTYSGIIGDSTGPGGGAVGLAKTGSGTLTLDQPNTFSGGFFLKANAITVANNSAFGTGTVTFGTAATRVNLNNGINLANPINVSTAATGVAFNGLIQNSNLAAGETVTLSGPITISSLVANGGHFASQGSGSVLNITGSITSSVKWSQRTGTVVYSGGGSYTDATLTGTARLGANNGLATNATLELGLSGNTTLDLAGFNQSLAGVTKSASAATIGNSSTTTDSTLTLTGSSTFAGVMQDSVSGGTRKLNLTMNGVGQTLTLTGVNTYSGATTINAGTLALTGTASINNSTTISVASGANYDVSGVTGGYSLASGQTLKGTGTVNGTISLTGGSTVSPGNSPGTLLTGNETWLAGASYLFEVDTVDTTLALQSLYKGTDPGADFLSITGTLDLSALSLTNQFIINVAGLDHSTHLAGGVTNWNPSLNYSWVLASASSGITGFTTDGFSIGTTSFASNNTENGTWSVTTSGNDLLLNYTTLAVPEPTTGLAGLVLGTASLTTRRRRRTV